MGPLLHIQDEGTVKTMDFTGWISSEEGENHEISRKGDSFLGYMRYNSYRLPSVEANDQWRLLRSLIGPFNNILKKKSSHLAKKKMLFHQDIARIHTCSAPNSMNYELLSHPAYSPDLALCDYFLFQTWRNDSKEKDWLLESSSSPKQKLILKGWTNHTIWTAWKSWRIVGSNVSS